MKTKRERTVASNYTKRRSWAIYVSSACLAATVLGAGWAAFQSYEITIQTTVESRASNELTNKAIELQINQSETLYQLSLVAFGALWTLLIARRDEVHFDRRNPTQMQLVTAATLSLIASVAWHVLYGRAMMLAFKIAGGTAGTPKAATLSPTMPDVFEPRIAHMFTFQVWFFAWGATLTLAILLRTYFGRGPARGDDV